MAVEIPLRHLLAWATLVMIGEPLMAVENVPPEGFTLVFNGQDLSGWKGLVGNPEIRAQLSPRELAERQERADERMREHWSVQDGILLFDGQGDNLCTLKEYGDFELLVDWSIQSMGDSGIYLRGSPQVQIWDPASGPAAGVGSGGLFNNRKYRNKPLVKADNPIGQWNHFRIRMVGENVTVWLNDQLVVDDTPLENYWDRNKPIYRAGAIELQSDAGPLSFKNIYIKELPSK